MDASIISALAALTGATIGGLTSGVANWLNHRSQVRAQWLMHERSRRQILYRDFIEEASKCYIDGLQHDQADIPGLIGVYAKLSAMRALSSKTVVQRAEDVARKILDTYLEPDKSFVELREMGHRWHDRSVARLQRRVPRRVRRNAVNAILSFTPRIQSAFRVVPPKIPRDGAPAS